MKRVSVLVLCSGLLFGCKVSLGSAPSTTAPSDAEAPAAPSPDASATTEPSDASSQDAKPKRTSPAPTPASWAEGLAALDAKADDAFEAVTTLFVQMHPQGSTRASTVRVDLEQLIAFVGETAAAADERVQASPALRSAACDSAGYGCGDSVTKDAQAEIAALQARGVRYYYTGEGSMAVGVDLAGIAAAVDAGLDGPSRGYLAAEHASMMFSQRFDEGGYGGEPEQVVEALTAWEALAADPGPYADIAPKDAAATRETYLRLCDAGEYETPSCKVSKELRASYNGFSAAHPSSPSVPAVEAFVAAMKKRRWRANRDQLDKIVAKALAAKP